MLASPNRFDDVDPSDSQGPDPTFPKARRARHPHTSDVPPFPRAAHHRTGSTHIDIKD